MAATKLLSDNGVTSGITGYQLTGGDDGTLQLQTTTAGGTATTAMTIDSSQNVGIGTSSPTFDIGSGVDVERTGETAVVRAYRTDASTLGGISLIGANSSNGIYSAGAKPVIIYTNETEQARIDSAGLFKFNSGYGSAANAYGCRAWVNFNGTGTVAIRGSGNVSSITDNGTGDYTVNMTTAMPDTNYSFSAHSNSGAGAAAYTQAPYITMTASALRLYTTNSAGSIVDQSYVLINIFR